MVNDNFQIINQIGFCEIGQLSPVVVCRRNHRRSEYNPSGLLVADYWEQQMIGEKNTGLEQTDELTREATSN